MSNYEKLEKEFKEKVEKLRKKCRHKDLNDWQKCSWKKYTNEGILHDQVLEIKTCKKCKLIINRRTKCLQCKNYTEEKDWFSRKVKEKGSRFPELANIEIKGVIFFCNENCFKEYKESKRRMSLKKIEIIEDIQEY